MRQIIIHTQKHTIQADVINNTLIYCDKDGIKNEIELEVSDSNYTYRRMHEAVIFDDTTVLCSFEEAKKIVNIIDDVDYKEL